MSFHELVKQLPSLSRRRAPLAATREGRFDSIAFLRWTCSEGLSHGELLAARLVLNAWNPDTDWVAEAKALSFPSPGAAARFDVFEAATVWDQAHLDALATWLTSPNKFP